MVGRVLVTDEGKGVRRLPVDKDVDADQFGGFEADEFVVQGRIAAGLGLELVVKVDDELGQGHLVNQAHSFRRQVVHGAVDPPFFLNKLHHLAHVLRRQEHRELDERLPYLLDLPNIREIVGTVGLDHRA